MIPPLPPTLDTASTFPSLQKWAFFNHSGVSPLPTPAVNAIRTYLDQSTHDAYMTGQWYKQAETTRRLAAQLINAHHSEIAFTKNTSEGLAFVANGLSWNPGDEILSTRSEYPANVYPWMAAAQRHGAKHIMVSPRADGRLPPEDLFAAVTPKTRLLAISHVQYGSGFRCDLAAIGTFCRDHNILFCVDAIQSMGVLPVDVQAMKIDYLSAGGHKWMLGPEGLGIFFCRKDLLSSLYPEVGWMNVINATDYDHLDFTLRPDAKRFECGGYNIAGVLSLGASLDMLLTLDSAADAPVGRNAGVPPASSPGPGNPPPPLPAQNPPANGLAFSRPPTSSLIWPRIHALTSLLATGLQQKGYTLHSPRNSESESSGIVSFLAPNPADHPKILQHLEAQHIILVEREKRLRAAPHFYQSETQIEKLLNALP